MEKPWGERGDAIVSSKCYGSGMQVERNMSYRRGIARVEGPFTGECTGVLCTPEQRQQRAGLFFRLYRSAVASEESVLPGVDNKDDALFEPGF